MIPLMEGLAYTVTFTEVTYDQSRFFFLKKLKKFNNKKIEKKSVFNSSHGVI
jgi:hypothetical protein